MLIVKIVNVLMDLFQIKIFIKDFRLNFIFLYIKVVELKT